MRDPDARRIAVGFFDGVHRGHQAILAGATVALTFRTHPLQLLSPGKAPRLIMTLADRVDAIRACGVAEVQVLDFTPELAAMNPRDFAAAYLKNAAEIRCGDNWRFGRGGRADAESLRALGFRVTVVPYAEEKGESVSSTRIRQALAAGDIAGANAMLGRPWVLRGTVEKGKGEGTRMGFPTINLIPDPGLVELKHGVYEVTYNGIRAIANYGLAPTMGNLAWHAPVCEVHIIEGGEGFSPARAVLKDPPPFVVFQRFIREERRFESVSALIAQIREDIHGILQGV